MTRTEMIGQCIMVGFPGTQLDADFIALVREYKIGNVVLFKHNVENLTQLKQLCSDIQELVLGQTGHPAFIGIDQEGGSVVRLPEDGINVPAAMALSATDDPENAYQAAALSATQLRALGINFNFAPSADINTNPNNPIIGARSFGQSAQQVTPYVLAALRAYQEAGILAAVKHFPGHGDTSSDSHIALPCIEKTLEEIQTQELIPFQAAIDSGCQAVMTSHILFPALEPEKIPATMSRRIITGLLREKWNFQGLVITDCMEMDAISRFYGTDKGAVRAISAGVDMVLISHSGEKAKEAFRAIQDAVEMGNISEQQLQTAVQRVLKKKEQYCLPPRGEAGTPQDYAKNMVLRRKTITLYHGEIPHLGRAPFFVGCADFRSGLVSNDGGTDTFAGYLGRRFDAAYLVVDKDPEPSEVCRAVEQAKRHTAIVACTYNGHLFEGQKNLVQKLAKTGVPMMVVALRNPYDLRFVPQDVAAVAGWDYTPMTLELIGDVLERKLIPQGKPPVDLGEDE